MVDAILGIWLTLLNPAGFDEISPVEMEEYYMVQAQCMADNVYHEARNQGTAGQMAVMAVTINRVNDDRFPNTICDVVKQGPHKVNWKGNLMPLKHQCQFSWYCDGKSDAIRNYKVYDRIFALSYQVLSGGIKIPDLTDGATFYHADYVQPAWASHKIQTIEIEDHIFYKWGR